MRKIWTKSVFDYNKKTKRYEVNEAESEFHYVDDDAPMTQMKGGGGGGEQGPSTTDRQSPWAPQQPYLQKGWDAAQNEFLNNQNGGVAPQSSETMMGLDKEWQRGMSGSPLNSSATGLLDSTLKGDYLYGGKGFDAALDAANRKITPMTNSAFERSGRGGSGLADVAKHQATSDAFASQYSHERDLQMQAAGLAPNVSNMDYNDINHLRDVGNSKDQYNQSKIDSRRNSIMDYMKMVQGNYGTNTDKNSTAADNRQKGWLRYLQNMSGGAMAGSSWGPYGAAAGAGLGLLESF